MKPLKSRDTKEKCIRYKKESVEQKVPLHRSNIFFISQTSYKVDDLNEMMDDGSFRKRENMKKGTGFTHAKLLHFS